MSAPAPKIHKPGFFASVRNSFLTGVVIAAPLLITFAVIYWLITGPLARLDVFVQNKIPQRWLPPFLEEVSIVPGFGVLVAVIFLILLGIVAKNFIGQFFINFGERVLDSVPVVRNLYGFFKNVFEMALQQSEQSFKEVALIEYPRPGLWTICFVVTSTKGEVRHGLKDIGDDMTNVFVPTTPNPTSGFLLFVPRSKLRPLEMSVEDGAKMIFSAGLVAPQYDPDAPTPLPSDTTNGHSGKGFRFLGRKNSNGNREA
ncbi:DUF502 domain-containing protein [Parvularcula marina]|uniref:DUF502 domain-containing protein n=1 Tax=Parvularcula marina TaxID=2292771 RepID=A0A371RKM3_9PROT|nr:DUF502 domain-containing protein [Parvularcula marina]RFB06003.1 DUF502 domain-containing protein [Parvularcula marina]